MPLRVLHLYAGNLYGGIERMLVTLARERGRCPEMQPRFGLCFDGRLGAELREAGADVHILGGARFSRPWTVVAARRRLRELLASQACDVAICHSTWPHAVFAATCRRRGIPLVFWAHDVPRGKRWPERLASRITPVLCIANSAYTASKLDRLFDGVSVRVLHPPVPDVSIDSDVAAHGTDTVILMASRLERMKGQLVLLNALAQLPSALSWRCWITTAPQRPAETRLLDEIRATVDRLELSSRVSLLDASAEVSTLFAAADIYCQPNLAPEGFGLSFIEAMYCGLPVVTSNIGGGAEAVSADCGILTPPGDVSAVADALDRLIRDHVLRASMGRRGHDRAVELCDPARVLPQVHETLSLVAGGVTA